MACNIIRLLLLLAYILLRVNTGVIFEQAFWNTENFCSVTAVANSPNVRGDHGDCDLEWDVWVVRLISLKAFRMQGLVIDGFNRESGRYVHVYLHVYVYVCTCIRICMYICVGYLLYVYVHAYVKECHIIMFAINLNFDVCCWDNAWGASGSSDWVGSGCCWCRMPFN